MKINISNNPPLQARGQRCQRQGAPLRLRDAHAAGGARHRGAAAAPRQRASARQRQGRAPAATRIPGEREYCVSTSQNFIHPRCLFLLYRLAIGCRNSANIAGLYNNNTLNE